MKPLELSAADTRILAALGRYRLLTVAQLVRLNVSDSKNLGERLRRLATAKYVAHARAALQSPAVYWMTGKAAAHFRDRPEFGEAWARACSDKGFSDGLHLRQRTAIVDVGISARAWAARTGATLQNLRTDFEASHALQRATTLDVDRVRYTPDALGELTDARGAPWVFSLEVETGGFSERLDNFTELLPHRLDVMARRVIDRGLNRPEGLRAARMLFVFTSAAMLGRVFPTLPDPAARHWRGVFFKALPDVMEDFGGDWLQADGRSSHPFTAIE